MDDAAFRQLFHGSAFRLLRGLGTPGHIALVAAEGPGGVDEHGNDGVGTTTMTAGSGSR